VTLHPLAQRRLSRSLPLCGAEAVDHGASIRIASGRRAMALSAPACTRMAQHVRDVRWAPHATRGVGFSGHGIFIEGTRILLCGLNRLPPTRIADIARSCSCPMHKDDHFVGHLRFVGYQVRSVHSGSANSILPQHQVDNKLDPQGKSRGRRHSYCGRSSSLARSPDSSDICMLASMPATAVNLQKR
jgi:hypothetical protein